MKPSNWILFEEMLSNLESIIYSSMGKSWDPPAAQTTARVTFHGGGWGFAVGKPRETKPGSCRGYQATKFLNDGSLEGGAMKGTSQMTRVFSDKNLIKSDPTSPKKGSCLGGGTQLKYFWNFHPKNWGFMIQFDEHFSDGLVQPPTRISFIFGLKKSRFSFWLGMERRKVHPSKINHPNRYKMLALHFEAPIFFQLFGYFQK